MANTFRISPSINFTETDLTFGTPTPNPITSLGLVGETRYGRAFNPMRFSNYDNFSKVVGELKNCYYPGTQQLQYETQYVAKEFLEEGNDLYVTRVLGLNGSDLGDAYSFTFGAALDPSTVLQTTSDTFTATLSYVNTTLMSVAFSDPVLQDLYDNGQIDTTIFNNGVLTTGDTVSMTDTFYGDCESYQGARFNGEVTNVEQSFICITGSTISTSGGTETVLVQNCVVLYGAGSVTYNSTFVISVVNPLVLINQTTNEVTLVSTVGSLILQGGTISHFVDGSVIIEDGTMVLPNGDIINGGTYKLCSLEGNDAVYLCDNGYTVNGDNIVITTGETSTVIDVFTTGLTTTIAQIPSGVKTIELSGDVITLEGTPYENIDETLVFTLRSYGLINSDEILNFIVRGNNVLISSLNGGKIKPFDEFRIHGTAVDGSTFSFIVSLDRTKKSYIGRVFKRLNTNSACCPDENPFYIEELYIEMFEKLVAEGKIDCIKPTVCFTSTLNDFKEQYTHAVTPWVVSELKGNKVSRLFRLHTFSDGNDSNYQVKVSIANIRPDNATFDVQVRAYDDTDKRPIVLESYSRVTMSETDNNFIGKIIGTYDETYPQKSKYILVELAGNCLSDSFPAGFEGYPIRDILNCKAPTVAYKTDYAATERPRNFYLGISDTVGIEKDLFRYLGKPFNATEWTGRTDGYHLDVNAANATVSNGDGETFVFQTSSYEFKNDTDITSTPFRELNTRKFTLVPYGGWDGWDVNRNGTRTNSDDYRLGGSRATKGLTTGTFDSYVMKDGTVGLTSDYYAFLKGIKTFDNPESVRVNVFATPTLNSVDHSNLIEEAIEMIEEDRCDMFYVIHNKEYNDGFEPLTPNELVENVDSLSSSWAATYNYGGLYEDTENNTLVYLSPVAFVVRSYAYTDRVAAPFWAPAGVSRGKVNLKTTRKKLKIGERDTLYDGRVNPMFYDRGSIYVWGNKTLYDDNLAGNNQGSALTLVNVRRMLINLRQSIANVSQGLLFEQNDGVVRSQFRNLITPILQSLQSQRGIFSYELQIDTATSSSSALNARICLTPIRALEQINIDFCLTNTGAEFTNI